MSASSSKSKCNFSCELFPPTTPAGNHALNATVAALQKLHPQFFSVTFGAGGSATQSLTTSIVQQLIDLKINVTPHITCVNLTRAEIDFLLQYYQSKNITRLVVIRGDCVEENKNSYPAFSHANELVHYIREKTGDHFTIYVGAYPECHPESPNFNTELFFYKEKIDSGANAAITQYFFNVNAYHYFREQCEHLKIHAPIIPGIMPMMNFEKLQRFSKRCQAEIPRWLCKRLESYQHSPESLIKFGIEMSSRLCDDLIQSGAPALHFYTLNSAAPCDQIIRNLSHLLQPHAIEVISE